MIYAIQYLRALAACEVVVQHTEWSRSTLGASGVDLFFVISGFIMMHVSGREPEPGQFLLARIRRVVPLYALLTITIGVAVHASLPAMVASVLFWPDVPGDPKGWPVIFQGWSLDYEMFFYLIFAGSLWLPARWRPLALTALLSALASVGLLLHPTDHVLAVYTNPIMLEFVAGCWIWLAWHRGMIVWPGVLMFAGTVLLLLQARHPPPVDWRPILWGGPYALILAGAAALRQGRPLRLPKLLGDASYAIYLTHWFVLLAVRPFVATLPAPAAIGAIVATCCGIGVLTHLCLEVPITKAAQLFARDTHRETYKA